MNKEEINKQIAEREEKIINTFLKEIEELRSQKFEVCGDDKLSDTIEKIYEILKK